jgi:hypothetical protein
MRSGATAALAAERNKKSRPPSLMHGGQRCDRRRGSLAAGLVSDQVTRDQVCPAGNTFCTAAVNAIDGRIYAIYPASRPQISAPLGWVLSSVSREAIAAAFDQQEATSCTASETQLSAYAGTVPFAI